MIFRALLLACLVIRLLADDRAAFDRARTLQASGDWPAAESAWRAYLKQNPNSAEALGNLGVVLAGQQRYDDAAAAYQRALRFRPSLHALRLNLGLSYYKAEKRAPAIEQFQIYLKTDPGNRQARQLLATALLESDRYGEAAREFETLLPSDDFSVRLGLATAYVRLGRRAEAQRLLADLVRHADSAEVQLVLGQAYLAENECEQADQAFRRALQLQPSARGVHFYLGASRWKQQDEPGAMREWRAELERDPASFEARFALGAALAEKGDPEEAERLLEQARRARPAHGPTLYYLGKLAWKQRRPEALALLERSVQADPDNRAAHYLLAQVYRARGRAQQAEKELAAVRRLSAVRVSQDVDILQGAQSAPR